MQTCRICDEPKPLDAFHFRKDNGKHRTECKDCRNKKEAAHRYNITVEDIDNLVARAGNRCEICGIHASEVVHKQYTTNPLVIDHCHTTGEVRGLLCPTCNSGLGHFHDDPEKIIKAAQYILSRRKI